MADVIVVPIHGTFAKNATWVEPSSPIMEKVLSDFYLVGAECRVAPFRWSGRNTIKARISASDKLVEHLQELLNEYEIEPKILILGHSHGGSVAGYAVKNNQKIRKSITGLVAMSTPWISVNSERFLEEIRLLFARVLSIAILLLFLGFFIPEYVSHLTHQSMGEAPESIYKGMSVQEEGSIYKDPLFAYSSLSVFVYLFFSIVGGVLIGILWTIAHIYFIRYVVRKNTLFSTEMEKYALGMNVANAPLPSTVVVVSEGDEASSLLKMLQWFSSLARELLGRICRVGVSITRIFNRLNRFVKTFILCTSAIGFSVYLLFSGFQLTEQDARLPESFVMLASIVLVLFVFVIFTTVLTAFAYGSFNLYSQLYCRFGVEPTPYGEHRMIMINSSNPIYEDTSWNSLLLKHSGIYLYKEGIERVASSLVSLAGYSNRTYEKG